MVASLGHLRLRLDAACRLLTLCVRDPRDESDAAVETLLRQCRFASDLFDTELVIRAERAGLEVAELPARTQEQRPSRTSIWRRAPRTLVGLVELRVTLWREARAR